MKRRKVLRARNFAFYKYWKIIDEARSFRKAVKEIGAKRNILYLAAALLLLFSPHRALAAQEMELRAELPYSLGKERQAVYPREVFMTRVTLFHPREKSERVTVRMKVPAGVVLVEANEGWRQSERGEEVLFEKQVDFSEGYGCWFDFLRLSAEAEGEYSVVFEAVSPGQRLTEKRLLTVKKQAVSPEGTLEIQRLVIPFDEDGKNDGRMDQAALLLRDNSLDYYKNLLTGKGAANTAAERAHPVTNMLIFFDNPARQQKLLLLKAYLRDVKSGERIPGLVGPKSAADEEHMASVRSEERGLSALAALDGDAEQRVKMPVYVDEEAVKGGEALLIVEGFDGAEKIVSYTTPLKILRRDEKAAWITAGMSLFAAGFLPFFISGKRIRAMKSRWLITAALFGTVSFAAVTVPTTLVGDFFHIILGPFSFLVTGMFSGVLLYMLLCGLIMLIPRVGILSLMLLVKLLINMIVFGHITPVGILLVGVQAVLLEMFFYGAGITKKPAEESAAGSEKKYAPVYFFLLCGVADAISTYVNLQAMAFLYRLYYAGWYIFLCTFISGFLYSGIGAFSGFYLGKELKKVGGD